MLATVSTKRGSRRTMPLLLLVAFAVAVLAPLPLPGTITCVGAVPSSMEAALSGSTFFWQEMLSLMSSAPPVNTAMLTALQNDLQAAAGSDVTVTLSSTTVNASALILGYSYVATGGTPITDAQVAANVNGKNFPQTEAAVNTASSDPSIAAVSELIPTSIQSITALYYNPAGDAAESLAITANVTYKALVLLTGAPSSWSTTLNAASNTVSANTVQAVEVLSNSRREVCTPTVDSMSVLPADPSFKKIGDGNGGLLVFMSMNCGSTTAMTGRFLDTEEYISMLLTLDTVNITSTFQSTSGSTQTVAVGTTATASATVNAFTCNNTCKGMIAMACVIAGLSAICVTITLIAICCPCCCVRVDREHTAQPSTMVDSSASNTVERDGVHVNGGEDLPQTPTTVARKAKRTSEPIEA
ncbi:hypothetical protein NESM_000345400 [Novymonas esmeraldas]|uniref:Membrane-associated protein n=1 Tax=Novymonas esmeraldas TaxID=1808958 RepID=A0AAW0EKZ1_9TRYP